MRILFILFLYTCLLQSLFAAEYIERNIGGFRAKLIKVQPNSQEFMAVSVSNSAYSLQELIQQVGGTAGINGAFFCPKDYKHCQGNNSSSALRIMHGEGKKYSKYFPDTGISALFGFLPNGKAIAVKQSIWGGDVKTNTASGFLSQVQDGIANFPLYLLDGKNTLWWYTSNELDAKMKSRTNKNFICSRHDGVILFGNVEKITIYEMPELLLKYSCSTALHLDSGGSTALYYDGKYKIGPGRPVMDAFVVVPRK